jgi:hypothetical protein
MQHVPPMTTIGELVSALYARNEELFRDEQLAARATQLALEELLRGRRRGPRRKPGG